ncbi:amidohydrolase family protein [Planctomicrobium sp.]|jgi:L-fuconolactonase|nr:amidohydrolase family protein [Planctomicrobium sp.]MDB4731328.1 amidohydrolase family protein [bacterium]MDB4743926.1 amidohydrolase family protein [Planctomicrobium sp.]
MSKNINRRSFIKQSAFAATVTAVPILAQGEKTIPSQSAIIDAHSHIWTTDLKSYPLQGKQTVEDLKPRSFTPKELMAVAAPHGVTKVVLIQHNIYHGPDNSYITDTIQNEPDKYSGVAKVNAQGADPVAEMTRLRKLGIRGLRILPADGGENTPWRDSVGMNGLWKNAPKVGVAMCPLINPHDLAEVKFMCEKYSETTVVIDHFARIGIDGVVDSNDLKNLVEIAKFPNANVKVSAYYALGKKKPPHTELTPMIKALYESYGPKRLMWASDCPYQLNGPNNYGDSIALIKDRIDFLSEADKRDILFNTAERVFFA